MRRTGHVTGVLDRWVGRIIRCWLAFAILALPMLLPGTVGSYAQAQSFRGSTSALNPFPEKDVWKALVIGDGFAEGTLHGLTDAFATESKLQIERKRHSLRTIGRSDFEEQFFDFEQIVRNDKPHIAVIFLGIADRTGMRLANGRRLRVGAEGWREQYGARVDRITRMLRGQSVMVYWIGLPIMRSEDWNEDVNEMNTLFRERVTANGGRFIDIYADTADETGEFVYRGPDVTGKVVRLRDGDGIDFTSAGYRKVAFYVERQLRRDMARAREERVVPLAGSTEEQARLKAEVSALTGGPRSSRTKSGKAGENSPAARAAAAWGPSGNTSAQTGFAGDQRADNGKVSFRTNGPDGKPQTVTMDIPRPALAASVIAIVTRRDKGDKPSPVGETLTDTLSNGLMVMRSVTPASGARRDQSASSPTQQPFFLALTKGARLPPKPGRADDFRWPREDDLPPPPVGPGNAAAAMSSPVDLKRSKTRTPSRGTAK